MYQKSLSKKLLPFSEATNFVYKLYTMCLEFLAFLERKRYLSAYKPINDPL